MKRSWGIGLAALLVVGASFAVGYAVGDGGAQASDYGFNRSEMAHMMIGGSLQRRVERHMQTLEQMRNEMTPQMREQLDDDDLWQMMQDGSLEEMMDELGGMMGDVPGMGGGMRGGGGGHNGGMR
jgi:hypothetical protein